MIRDVIRFSDARQQLFAHVYTVYVAVVFVVAPLLTASFVLSFFKNVSASVRYFLSRKADIYLMSCLSDRSVTLAENIMAELPKEKWCLFKPRKRRLILFADVFEKEEEENFELLNRANRLGAICFKKDITEIPLKYRKRGIRRTMYFIGDDENENVKQALTMIQRCKRIDRYDIPETQFYVFANTVESEMLFNSTENGRMKVRRVRQSRNLVMDMLRRNPIFPPYQSGRVQPISIAIIGLGRHGTELLKAISWCGQMIGYTLEVHVFDAAPNAEEAIRSEAPELIQYNHARLVGEPYYDFYFHSGVDVRSMGFLEQLSGLSTLSAVYITLGDDELDVETAVRVRMQLGRDKIRFGRELPPIYTVVYSSLKSEIFRNGLKDTKDQDYGITFVGSMKERYSLHFIEQAELEAAGLACHRHWAEQSALDNLHLAGGEARTPEQEAVVQEKLAQETAKYEKYEYFRRSSMAEALYADCRERLGIRRGESADMDASITQHEHKRWNAYMRSEGYIGGSEKNEIAKTHKSLIPFGRLDENDIRRDQAVAGTIPTSPKSNNNV